jgi:hypothetical protein
MQEWNLKLRRAKDFAHPIHTLVFDERIKDWCKFAYPGHKKGCPNYLSPNKPKCPHNTPMVYRFFDLHRGLYFVVERFSLLNHVKKMKAKHPQWTERQLRNVLYWQNRPKSALKEQAKNAMELLGADVYTTMRRHGLILERIRHLKTAQFIALIGWKGSEHKYNF